MIVGLLDLPNREHDFMNEIIKNVKVEIPVFMFHGTKEELKKYKGTREEIVFWDNPNLIENDEVGLVDKVLEVVRFHGSLTEEENRIVHEREKSNYPRYIIGSRGVREEITTFFEYFVQWMDEIQGRNVLTDEQIKEVTEGMVKEHGIEVAVHMESAFFLGTLARYLYWVNRITMNPYRIRKNKFTLKELQLTVAHELGHRVDPNIAELSKRKMEARDKARKAKTLEEMKKWFSVYRELLMILEQNAWDNCYPFCPSTISKEEVKEREIRGMKAYERLLGKEEENLVKKLGVNKL